MNYSACFALYTTCILILLSCSGSGDSVHGVQMHFYLLQRTFFSLQKKANPFRFPLLGKFCIGVVHAHNKLSARLSGEGALIIL